MSTETEKLKLFKWDTSNEIDLESDFDIEKTLNENWDRIDDNTAEVSKKNIEQDNSISELQEEIENLRNISNIMPSVNETGENRTLNNTAKNVRFRKFKVGGNSEQETREGYNLLNANLPYTTSSNGNTIKWLGKENIPKLEVNKYYYLHGKFSDGTIFSGAHAAFVIIDSVGQILNKTFGSSFQNTVDISNATDCYIYTDSTYVNKTVTEVAIYEGKENKAYEQHGASPSPDYQSPIKTVGSTKIIIEKSDKTQKQEYIMPVQNEMLEGDYFDWNNEEEVHGWKKIILNGTENWQLYSAGTNISRRFGLALTENVPRKETEKYGKGYSTHFEITQFINGDLSIFLQVEPNNWYIAVTDANSKWSSIVEFKSWLKAKYDAGTPVVVYYKTATETRILFTDEQKAVAKEIQKATSYEDATHIYSTDEVSPIFDVEAVADIRKLITNISTTAEGEN